MKRVAREGAACWGWFVGALCLAFGLPSEYGATASAQPASQAESAPKPAAPASSSQAPVPGAEIFSKPTLVTIKIALSPEAQASLRKEPRRWVNGTVTLDGEELAQVGIHLKSTTSFLPLDKKPSWTLSFSRHKPGRRWLGLRKIHLNNSVQNPSYLNEDLAGELFRRAGVPCARSAWAKVQMNERDLGLYVLKEGFSPEFLALSFGSTDGNFYDGGLHHEIDEPLELDSGNGPEDRSDLRSLYLAATTPDLPNRWRQFQALLDVDRFVSMMAMESLTVHVDGYSLMQNNYRIYFDPVSKRAVFIVHGLDRMFEQADYPIEPRMVGLVSKAVLEVPAGQRLYRQKLAELSEKVFDPLWISNRMESAIQLLKKAEPLVEPEGKAVRQRALQRATAVRKHLPQLPAAPP